MQVYRVNTIQTKQIVEQHAQGIAACYYSPCVSMLPLRIVMFTVRQTI